MRDEFRDIVSGWTLIDDVDDLSDRLMRLDVWMKINGSLLPDEEATIKLMIEAGVARLESQVLGPLADLESDEPA